MEDGGRGECVCASLVERGFAVLPNLLDASTCQQLLTEVHASPALASGHAMEEEKPVYCSTCRHNVMMHVTRAVQKAARLLLRHEAYEKAIETLLGREAAIFELAPMMTLPGAAQPVLLLLILGDLEKRSRTPTHQRRPQGTL